ncbi:MAG: SH3 domain-containing protein [Anaerolineae bacterium]|nr:SH3 domain-containing protein [Anaerolineae bacterium]
MKLFSGKRWALAVLLALLLALPMSFQTALAQPQYAVPLLVANTSFLNVRTGPGVQYTTLVTVVGGSELPVLAIGSDGVWYLISTPVGVGWVNVDFTVPRGNFSVVPTINVNAVGAVLVAPVTAPTLSIGLDAGQGGGPATAASTSTVERFRAQINVEFVNLRYEPQDNSAPIAIVSVDPTGVNDYSIVGRSVDSRGVEWLQIDMPGTGTGWIEAPKLKLRLSARYRTVLQVVADVVGMTADPVTNEGIGLPVLTRNQEVFLLDISANSQLVKVETGDGIVGWLPFNSLQTRMGTTSDTLAAEEAANPPAAPFVDGQGGGGPTPVIFPQLEMPHVIVNTSYLNIRGGPGSQYASVATVSGGTQLDVLGRAHDDVWLYVRGTFGTGWVNNEFTLFRGIIDNVPYIDANAAVTLTTVQTPVAIFSTALTLYAAPGVNFGAVAFVNGPAELPVVARTADGNWVQVNSPAGFGWVLASQVVVRGDPNLIPVVG